MEAYPKPLSFPEEKTTPHPLDTATAKCAVAEFDHSRGLRLLALVLVLVWGGRVISSRNLPDELGKLILGCHVTKRDGKCNDLGGDEHLGVAS